MKIMLVMSDNLKKQVKSQIKFDGHKNSSFVRACLSINNKIFEVKNKYDISTKMYNTVNELGLGQTILIGNMGFLIREVFQ